MLAVKKRLSLIVMNLHIIAVKANRNRTPEFILFPPPKKVIRIRNLECFMHVLMRSAKIKARSIFLKAGIDVQLESMVLVQTCNYNIPA